LFEGQQLKKKKKKSCQHELGEDKWLVMDVRACCAD